MEPQNIIKTNRLNLALLNEADHAFIAELLNTEGWIKFIGERNIRTKEDAIAYIEKINNAPNITYWTVKETATQDPAGLVTLIQRDYLDEPDIGFAFLPAFSGKGYAYEAAIAVMTHITADKNLTAIHAVTLPHNNSSIKLIEKLGLKFARPKEVNNELLHIYSTSFVQHQQ